MPRLSRLFAAVAAATLVLSGTAHAQDDPLVVITSPTTHSGAEVGVPILITGSSLSPTPGTITATELTFDGGATWVTAERLRVLDGFRTDWRYVHTPDVAGDVTVAGRAVTAAGAGPTGAATTVHIGGATVPQQVHCEIRCEFITPYAAVVDDPDVFPTPVPVEPDRDYVISYYTPQGGYAMSENYFTGTLVQAPFTAPHDGTRGAGVYRYGGGFPTDSRHDSTYWVQPEFQG